MSPVVTCQVCGGTFKRITHKHLKHHSLTLADYASLYPEAPLYTEELRNKFASNDENKWIAKHGAVDGPRLYADYKNMLAVKNTFEHKRDTYGWSREQFDAYNKRRATTLANMVERYGDSDGRAKWEQYRAQQAIAGVTESWFIDKYGAHIGRQMWQKVCQSKRHTLPNYIQRYGVDIGTVKYHKWLTQLNRRGYQASAPELEVATCVREMLDESITMYSHLTKQYCKWSAQLDSAVMYDVVIPTRKLAIEFNGDFWHCNPAIYSADFMHPVRKLTASQIWEYDRLKLDLLASEGYTTMVIWELDWVNHKQQILQEIQQCLT